MADSETELLCSSESGTNSRSMRETYSDEFNLTESSAISPFYTDDRPRSLRERIKRSPWYPVSFILAFTFFITIVEHGVRFNIVLYTEEVLDYTRGNAPVLVAVFDAVAPCLPLIGGWLADAWFPRLRVIVVGSIITFFGTMLLTINVAPYSDGVEANFSITAKRALFVIGFTSMFVGLALYDANDYVMAAREIEKKKDEGQTRNLFCVFYVVYFTAVFLSQLMFEFVDDVSFFVIYLLAACSAIFAMISALLGRRLYAKDERNKQTLWNQFRIIWEGIRRRKDAPKVKKWIHRASIKHGGSFTQTEVYETSHLLRTIPIFHTVTIFIIVNYFINNTYPKQTLRLKPAVKNDVTLAEVMYQLYQPIVSVLTNVIMLAILNPCFNRCGCCVSAFVRIGVGIVVGTLSIVFAAIVETERKRLMEEEPFFNIVDNITINASSLSVTSQIPQYTCAGISEVLVLTAGVEISYTEAPPHLKGFTVGLFLLMSGVGSYIMAQLIIIIVNGISRAAGHVWYTAEEINSGHLEYFYYLLAAILLLDLLYVYLVSRTYERANWHDLDSILRRASLDDEEEEVEEEDNKDGKEDGTGVIDVEQNDL